MHPDDEKDALEAILDRTSPAELLEMLVDIAGIKADHVRTNWQDEPLAKLWEKIARSLDRETERLHKIGNPYA